jgi:hemolysin activation/secretion protein
MRYLYYFKRLSVVSALLSLASLLPLHASALDLPAPKFVQSGQWGNAYFPPMQAYSAYGPQINLGDIDIKPLKQNVYIEKSLQSLFTTTSTDPIRLKIEALSVEGALNNSNAEVKNLLDGYSGREVTLQEITTLAAKLEDIYQAQKLPSVIYCTLQEDTAANQKTLVFRVASLKVRDVKLTEGRYFKGKSIQSHLLGLEKGERLNIPKLEKSLRQLQANPDLTLTTELEPIAFSNEVDVSLKVEDSRPWHIVADYNNLNVNIFGGNFAGAYFIHNNITGHGDSLLLAPIFSLKGQGVISRYELPVGRHGTRLFGEYAFNHVRPLGADFNDYKAHGSSHVFTAGLQQILYDKNHMRIAADTAFSILQQRSVFADNQPLEREQIRNLRLGIQLDRDDRSGNTSMRHEVDWGVPLFAGTPNSSDKLSYTGGGNNYFWYTGSLVRTQNLPGKMTLISQVVVNLTDSQLPSFYQWGPGGSFLGRGYRESYLGGDSAILFTNDLRIPMYFIPKKWHWPGMEDSVRENTLFNVFFDYTQSHLNKSDNDTDATEQLMGTGVGLRVNVGKKMSLRADLGVPLLRMTPFSQRPRLHFGIQYAI